MGKKKTKDLSGNDTKKMIQEYWAGLCVGADGPPDGPKDQRAIRKQYEKGSVTTKGVSSLSGMNSNRQEGGANGL